MRAALILGVISMASVAHADPAADAKAGFQRFVDAVAAKQQPAELDTFIAPDKDEEDAVGDVAKAAASLGKPMKIVGIGVAKSGTGAWIAATLGEARATAFLVKDAKGWHVTAAHISLAKAEQRFTAEDGVGCGMVDEVLRWPASVPKDAKAAADTLDKAFMPPDGGKHGPLDLAALSDDKSALVFGSAPKEQWTGGAKIKKVFDSWKIDLGRNSDLARAGIAPGGDLAWVAEPVTTDLMCKQYRAMFVLQKERGTWKIVHQHYSDPQ